MLDTARWGELAVRIISSDQSIFFSDKKLRGLQIRQFILKIVRSAGILLPWLFNWFDSLLVEEEKRAPE